MRYSEVAFRYASAIFDIASEKNMRQQYLTALRGVHASLCEDKAVWGFVESPLVRAAEKEKVLKSALASQKLPAEVVDLALLLAKKNRLALIGDIVEAFQAKEDKESNITRGTVKSAVKMSDSQKGEIQKFIDGYTRKKVMLSYVEDKNLLGGVTAQVGSLTFDDSVASHLKRIKEDLTRSNV